MSQTVWAVSSRGRESTPGSGPVTGGHRPAPSVSIISGCVGAPVHIVVEDHHDALGQRDRFQLLDSFGGRTLRVERGVHGTDHCSYVRGTVAFTLWRTNVTALPTIFIGLTTRSQD